MRFELTKYGRICGVWCPLGVLLAACLVAFATPWALAAAATLDGVLAQPDGSGARIQVVLSGPFRYRVTPRPDSILITLDGVVSTEITHHLMVGPVTGVLIRPKAGPRVDVVVTTRTPLDVVGESLDDYTLVLRLAPPETVARQAQSTSPPKAVTGPSAPSPISAPPAATPARVPSGPAKAPVSSPPPAPPSESQEAGILAGRILVPASLRMEAGTGRLFQIDDLVRVSVSDPKILGVVPISNRELLVNAQAEGRTTMYVWEGVRRLLAYTVEVVPATDRFAGLRRLLASLFPGAAITVTGVAGSGAASASVPGGKESGIPATGSRDSAPYGVPAQHEATPPSPPPATDDRGRPSAREAVPAPPGSFLPTQSAPVSEGPPPDSGAGSTLVLSGEVETQLDRKKVEEIARAFALRVVNLLSVRQPIQLKLQVQVVELNRNILNTFGITWGGGQTVPGSSPSLNGGVYNLQVITAPGLRTNGLDLLVAQIQALAQNGLARLLAEPSLVVLAGRTASLLLGGQVPIPVSGPYGSVTIEYKDFGVILNVQPDYQEDGRVFLQINPEVSTLDFANAIKVSGFTIPALRVRRAQTVVSLLPTQTLVLGGLLQHEDSELIQKIPLLGDLPIIGQLFRSSTFQHQDTDLVIFVTPVLVEQGGPPALDP